MSKPPKNEKPPKENRRKGADTHAITDPLLEAAGENLEALFDALTDSEVLKEFPVLGTAVKLFRSGQAARAAMFASKLEKFVFETERCSPKAAKKIRDKVAKSPADAEKIGKAIAYVIERASEDEKPRLVGRLFAGFLSGRVNSAELRRLLFAIDTAFIDDLNALIARDLAIHPSYDADWVPFLAGSGFSHVIVDTKFDDSQVRYGFTPLAHLLQQAVASA
jgi:hypothetical protein